MRRYLGHTSRFDGLRGADKCTQLEDSQRLIEKAKKRFYDSRNLIPTIQKIVKLRTDCGQLAGDRRFESVLH
jgi:hypothetical protein